MTHAQQTAQHPQPDANAAVRHTGHPGAKEYVVIALILAFITAIEVAIYYIPAMRPILPPILIVLSLTKFTMVAMFFMHLKFDSRFFSVVFITGILIAVFVFVIFLTMIRVLFV